jgi:hypothetical protein
LKDSLKARADNPQSSPQQSHSVNEPVNERPDDAYCNQQQTEISEEERDSCRAVVLLALIHVGIEIL